MAAQVISEQAKLFLLDADTTLRRLQRLSVAGNARESGQAHDFGLAYQNALLTVLGQIAFFPDVHSMLHASLLRVAREEGSLQGLEPVLLTLLNAAGASGDHQLFQSELALWRDSAASTSFPNPDAIPFYNVTNKAMTVLTSAGLKSLRPGGSHFEILKSPSTLGKQIEQQVGAAIISNVFDGQNPFDTLPGEIQEGIQTLRDTAETVGAVLLAAQGLGIITGPVGAIIAGIIFLINAVIDGIHTADDLASDLSAAQSVQVAIQSITVGDGWLISDGKDDGVNIVDNSSSRRTGTNPGTDASTTSTRTGTSTDPGTETSSSTNSSTETRTTDTKTSSSTDSSTRTETSSSTNSSTETRTTDTKTSSSTNSSTETKTGTKTGTSSGGRSEGPGNEGIELSGDTGHTKGHITIGHTDMLTKKSEEP